MASGVGRSPSNLPAEVTRFVGRRSELLEARRLLEQTRLLTLAGPGGVGKTRLALSVAGQMRRTFPDGVWLVDLAPLEDPELLAVTVVDGLGVRDESTRSPIDVLRAHLADKSMLVVLDNCEHLLERCAELVAALLRAAPGLRIMTTSREPLRVDGEQVFVVPPLSLPGHADAPARDVLASEAVALLTERAEAAVPGFAVRQGDAPILAGIARALDGVPLAIELAAVQLRALSPKQLLDRLDDALGLLTTGIRATLPRQRTLRAMIDWSFDLCSPEERVLWARLAVFAGGFDLEAVEQVCSGDGLPDDLVNLVAALVDKSIVQREEHGPRLVRYRLLETIRQYGRERLASCGEQHELRRRHRDWYQRMTAQAGAEWYGPRQLEWFSRLRLEHANARAALDFCVSQPGEAAAGLSIASALRVYWHASGSLTEARRWLGPLLDLHPDPDTVRARAVCTAGLLALYHNDAPAAAALTREARDLALRLDDPRLIAWSALGLGFAAMFDEDLPGAVPMLEEAVSGLRAVGDPGGTLLALMLLATAAFLLGEQDRAVLLGQEGLMSSESLGESWMRAWLMWVLGIVAWRQGDVRRAAEFEHAAVRLKQAFQDDAGIGQCTEVLAWIASDEGRHDRAVQLLGAVHAIWRRTGSSLYRHLTGFHERVAESLRRFLGEEAFEASFREGTRLTFEQTVCYALEERPAARARPVARAENLLTRRESEIAELIARGLTNREIARELVISQRTVDTHVEHILTKLGFSSRTQIASWIGGDRSTPSR